MVSDRRVISTPEEIEAVTPLLLQAYDAFQVQYDAAEAGHEAHVDLRVPDEIVELSETHERGLVERLKVSMFDEFSRAVENRPVVISSFRWGSVYCLEDYAGHSLGLLKRARAGST
jgi:hypothetical protein